MDAKPMSPSRRRVPRVGGVIAVTAVVVLVTAAMSPLAVSAAATGLWRGLGALLGPPSGPVPAAPLPQPDPTPVATTSTRGSDSGALVYPLETPGVVTVEGVAYALLPLGLIDPLALAPATSPHTPFILTSDGCGACHRGHAAQDPILLSGAATQASLCFSCHGSTPNPAVPAADVQTAFGAVPPNDPANASWYAHPAPADTAHVAGIPDEFSGRLERHASCGDCHDPHNTTDALAMPGPAGWSASGAIAGGSGVRVLNGVAGSTPVYALVRNVAFEYELCFKCHAGWTKLPAQDPLRPSTWALDKGIELNFLNASYHPIEAPGWNATAAMANSLAGGTLWQFGVGDTVRCVNCHGDPSKAVLGTAPGARLAPHASAQRGLLIAPYRDRLLKPAGAGYQGTDFTLCYLCHAEAPFTTAGSGATNFDLHAKHMSEIANEGSGGTDIDVAGAGQGNAICAECHFRLHSTALAVKPGDVNNARLVNFAPNVTPRLDVLKWTGAGSPTCTLTCHGVAHSAAGYERAAVQNAALGVDARISIASGGAIRLGESHVFTVTVEKNDGSGYDPAAGIAVAITEDGVGSIDAGASTCDDSLTNVSGQCIVVLTSSSLGVSTVDATATVSVEGVVGPVIVGVSTTGHGAFGVSNTITWVDARITIGTSGTSPIGAPYTFTVTVEQNNGSGWVPAVGTAVGASLTAGVGAITGGTCDGTGPDTDDAGGCTIIVESSEVGASTIDASATVSIGGASISVSTGGYGAHNIDNAATWVEPAPPPP